MEQIERKMQPLDKKLIFIPKMRKMSKKDEDFWNGVLLKLAHTFELSQDIYEIAPGERQEIIVKF